LNFQTTKFDWPPLRILIFDLKQIKSQTHYQTIAEDLHKKLFDDFSNSSQLSQGINCPMPRVQPASQPFIHAKF
jgi:hypothetical protein